MSITGECFCGAVRYQVEGKLKDARSCHCSKCRKAFSSQASAYALVEPDTFIWLSGEEYLTTYTGKQGAGKQFCRVCGSMLTGVFDGKVHGVALGCLNGDPDVKLAMHIFVASKAAWETIADDIPQYQQGPPENQ